MGCRAIEKWDLKEVRYACVTDLSGTVKTIETGSYEHDIEYSMLTKAGKFLTKWANISSSRRHILCGNGV
jgi:hypothetical protein